MDSGHPVWLKMSVNRAGPQYKHLSSKKKSRIPFNKPGIWD